MTQAPASDTFSFDRYQERKDILSLMQKSAEYSFNIIRYHGEESAEITGYEGTAAFLRIPGELGGFPVRSIGRRAFADRKETEELVLPEKVRRIGDFAFYGCPKLKILDLSDGTVRIDVPKQQKNSALSSTVGCDVMAVIPAGSGPLPAGTVLKGYLMN